MTKHYDYSLQLNTKSTGGVNEIAYCLNNASYYIDRTFTLKVNITSTYRSI